MRCLTGGRPSRVVVLLAAASLASADPAAPRAQLDGEVSRIVLAAEARREPTPELLRMAADSASPHARARALLALGRIGVPTEIAALLEGLRAPQVEVQVAAAFALGLIRHDWIPATSSATAARAAAALEAVIAAGDPDPITVAAVATSLAMTGTDGARKAIAALLPRTYAMAAAHPEPAAAAIGAWSRLGGAIDVLQPMAAADAVEVRRAVARALADSSDPNAAPSLLTRLDDPDPIVRVLAVTGLVEAPLPLAERHLDSLLADRDWRVVRGALEWTTHALTDADEIISEAAFTALLRRSLDRNLHVKRAALRALGATNERWSVAADRLLQAIDDPESAVRAEAIAALARRGGRSLGAALAAVRERYRLDGDGRAGLQDAGAYEARAVVDLLASSPEQRDRVLLAELASGGPAVAQLTALARLAPHEPLAVAEIAIDLARTVGASERSGVLELLRTMLRRGDLDALPEVREVLPDLFWDLQRDAGESGHARLQLQALDALAELGAPLLERRVELLLESPRRGVRLWVAERLAAVPVVRDRLRDRPEIVLAGQATAVDPVALAALVGDLLRAPARLAGRSERGEFVLELRADRAPLAVSALLGMLESGPARFVVGAGAGGEGRLVIAEADRPPLLVPREPWPADPGDGVLLADVGVEADAGMLRVVRAGSSSAAPGSQLATVIEGVRALDRLQPGDVVTLSLLSPRTSADADGQGPNR